MLENLASSVIEQLQELVGSLSDGEKVVARRRLSTAPTRTLEEVAREIDRTRERVRQIQAHMSESIEAAVGSDVDELSSDVLRYLPEFTERLDLDRRLSELFGSDAGLAGDLAKQMLFERLELKQRGRWLVKREGEARIKELRSIAANGSDDVGLLDEPLLQKACNAVGANDWPALVECCGFYRISGELALRHSKKARVKAALLRIGRLATKAEIAGVADLPESKIGAQLSVISSIVRADKSRWGLIDWVDDEYQGIPAEIIQRIREDGGATALSRLTTELPERFGVTEDSVRAYVATPQFVLRDGYVSIADESALTFRPLADVITGRDCSGNPYWTFTVESRYFDGYSLVGVPPEIARELGCGANDRVRVELTHPAGCPPLSVNWRLSSITGAEIGYLSEPLGRLGARPGQEVCLHLVCAGSAELRVPIEKRDSVARELPPDALLERLKSRRKLL